MQRQQSRLFWCLFSCGLLGCAYAEQNPLDTDRPAVTASHAGSGGHAGVVGTTATGGSTSSTTGSPSYGGAGTAGSSAGTSGAGGTTGNTAGSSGTSGTGGSGGSSGSGATSGSGGGSGTGSSNPFTNTGECASTATARVEYKSMRADSVIQFQLHFYNEDAAAVALNQYEFDYYFSNEEDSAWHVYVDNAATNGGTDGYVPLVGVTTATIEELSSAATGATHVIRILIASAAMLEATDVGELSIRVEPTSYDPPQQAQADDYSFDATKTNFADWDHVSVLAGGDLAWGCMP